MHLQIGGHLGHAYPWRRRTIAGAHELLRLRYFRLAQVTPQGKRATQILHPFDQMQFTKRNLLCL